MGVAAGVVTGGVDGVRYGWWLNPIAGYYRGVGSASQAGFGANLGQFSGILGGLAVLGAVDGGGGGVGGIAGAGGGGGVPFGWFGRRAGFGRRLDSGLRRDDGYGVGMTGVGVGMTAEVKAANRKRCRLIG